MTDSNREEFYREKVAAQGPDQFVNRERQRGLSWEVIWNTYFAEEFEERQLSCPHKRIWGGICLDCRWVIA
jgi:hypothetical protein